MGIKYFRDKRNEVRTRSFKYQQYLLQYRTRDILVHKNNIRAFLMLILCEKVKDYI